MKSHLDFAIDHRIPIDYISDTNLVLGIKGSGKTYTGMKLAESMVGAGAQVAVIDITGVWWGLTSSADGKSPGLPLYIFGGNHAHAPLEPGAGEVLARWTVESGQSLILDLSLMRKGEAHRLCADYLENLYRLKASHRESMHLMLDEANRVAPQRPGKDQLRVLGAAEDIVLQGRSRGLGLTMLTQRPAILHNDLRTQAAAILLHRISSPHDQRAVKEWLDIHATPEQGSIMLKSLATLKNGEAWYFSTSGEGDPVRVKVAKRQTFDSSRTPKPGERAIQPKSRSEIDLDKLSAEIRQTAQTMQENKPERLRARIRELEQAAINAKAAKPVAAIPAKVRRVEVPILKAADRDKLLLRLERLAAEIKGRADAMRELRDSLTPPLDHGAEIIAQIGSIARALSSDLDRMAERATFTTAEPMPHGPGARQLAGSISGELRRGGSPRIHYTNPEHPKRLAAGSMGNGDGAEHLAKVDRAFLTALAQHGALNRIQIHLHAGYARSGDTSKSLARLLSSGWANPTSPHGDLAITEAGRAILGEVAPLPTGAARRSQVEAMSPPDGRFMAAAFASYPQYLSRGVLHDQAGYRRSGDTSKSLARLIRMGYLVTGPAGALKAADEFFPARGGGNG